MISILFVCFVSDFDATDYCPPDREVQVAEFRGPKAPDDCEIAKHDAVFQTKFKAPNAQVWYYCESSGPEHP